MRDAKLCKSRFVGYIKVEVVQTYTYYNLVKILSSDSHTPNTPPESRWQKLKYSLSQSLRSISAPYLRFTFVMEYSLKFTRFVCVEIKLSLNSYKNKQANNFMNVFPQV